jgi:hypothetical protein
MLKYNFFVITKQKVMEAHYRGFENHPGVLAAFFRDV